MSHRAECLLDILTCYCHSCSHSSRAVPAPCEAFFLWGGRQTLHSQCIKRGWFLARKCSNLCVRLRVGCFSLPGCYGIRNVRLFHWIWTNQAALYWRSCIFFDKINLKINYSAVLAGKRAGMHPSLPVIAGCVCVYVCELACKSHTSLYFRSAWCRALSSVPLLPSPWEHCLYLSAVICFTKHMQRAVVVTERENRDWRGFHQDLDFLLCSLCKCAWLYQTIIVITVKNMLLNAPFPLYLLCHCVARGGRGKLCQLCVVFGAWWSSLVDGRPAGEHEMNAIWWGRRLMSHMWRSRSSRRCHLIRTVFMQNRRLTSSLVPLSDHFTLRLVAMFKLWQLICWLFCFLSFLLFSFFFWLRFQKLNK